MAQNGDRRSVAIVLDAQGEEIEELKISSAKAGIHSAFGARPDGPQRAPTPRVDHEECVWKPGGGSTIFSAISPRPP